MQKGKGNKESVPPLENTNDKCFLENTNKNVEQIPKDTENVKMTNARENVGEE